MRPQDAEMDAAAPEPAQPHPGMTLGQYQLIRELGRGGMGMVYLARDTLLGRRVAIKFVAHDNPSLAKRFLAEARVTANRRGSLGKAWAWPGERF